MSGITDRAFRQVALDHGAGMAVCEMVASKEWLSGQKIMQRKAQEKTRSGFHVIQLVGREPELMGEAAKHAQDQGADIVDINMGCPARRVTRGAAGSALMKEPILAEKVVEQVVNSVDLPVTLKMRLGWNDESQNAPELANRFEQIGVQAFAVHARTRCDFYNGEARWELVKAVTTSTNKPVFINGDIIDSKSANIALQESGAAGLMVGRAAIGNPWIFSELVKQFTKDELEVKTKAPSQPAKSENQHRKEVIIAHFLDSLSLYGKALGVRQFRKQLKPYLQNFRSESSMDQCSTLEKTLCVEENPDFIIAQLQTL